MFQILSVFPTWIDVGSVGPLLLSSAHIESSKVDHPSVLQISGKIPRMVFAMTNTNIAGAHLPFPGALGLKMRPASPFVPSNLAISHELQLEWVRGLWAPMAVAPVPLPRLQLAFGPGVGCLYSASIGARENRVLSHS